MMSASKIFGFFFASSLLALAACGSSTINGNGGGGTTNTGTGSTTDTSTTWGQGGGGPCDFVIPQVCTADSDCVVKLLQLNCCGSQEAVGVASSGVAQYDVDAAACAASFPACDCGAAATKAEDGASTLDSSGADIPVKCQAGHCQTYVPPGKALCKGAPTPLNCESTGCPDGWSCTKDPDPNTCHSSNCICGDAGWACTSDCGMGGSSCMKGL
jgi:hypothetical protein